MAKSAQSFSSAGALFAAAACPICFPKLAAIGALLGLGALAPFEVYFFWGAQILVLLTLAAQLFSFRSHKNYWLLFSFIGFTLLFFISLYLIPSELMSYLALAGIGVGSIWNLFV